MKDWTGNKRSIHSTLGASNHSKHDRELNDYYATDPIAIELLLDSTINTDLYPQKYLWENACGGGHLVEALTDNGFCVNQTDLIKRYNQAKQLDFLNEYQGQLGKGVDIITNPPYKHAMDWVYKSLDCLHENSKLFLFLKLTFLEGQKRRKLFDELPPKKILVSSKRIMCAINGDFEKSGKKSSAACYAWFIWQKGFNNSPTIGWL